MNSVALYTVCQRMCDGHVELNLSLTCQYIEGDFNANKY